ncbi:laminin-binding protein Lsa27 [Leptospira interrogans]|uniref:Putative lipoprotein n=1 Tax=Leptospira interrogans serovar Zanoni str. LT2156 TaxID=1001601 RepID=M6HK08_LEPIR|nr:hypothetical protein [Leptospira interrogans]EMM97663.1 putative lipoprotein [Leptospira interrogans serovar Zanoni str. LT2156]EMN82102.1 putative lipoprotein [Leptospira interrogans serovar Grippotyphosa str. UI 12764]
MKKLKYTNILFLFAIGFVFSCGPKEEQLAEGIKYLGGSNPKAEDQFKSIGLNARDIAKERLMKDLLELKEGIEKKKAYKLTGLSSPALVKNIQRTYNLSFTEALDGWDKSFEKGKAWCDYDLLFKDKIVSYEIEPMEANQDVLKDGTSNKDMRYRVYLRKEGQTGKLTLENSHVLVFEGHHLRNGVWVGFSIDAFVNHCPILSPEEEQYLKDFESSHPGQGEQ